MMCLSIDQLVKQIHASSTRIVLAVAGGGSRAIAMLLEVPGASRTLIEAVVPYSERSMAEYLGGLPDQSCSAPTARAMAMAAMFRAEKGTRFNLCKAPSGPLGQIKPGAEKGTRFNLCEAPSGPFRQIKPGPFFAGVSCTAGLASDRPKRGPHRAHLAIQTAGLTATRSVELRKGHRSRAEEEQLVARLVLNAVAEACGVDARVGIDLLEGERVDESRTIAPRPWQELLLGRSEAVRHGGGTDEADTSDRVIFSGSFNPVHAGHRRMIQIAQEILDRPVQLEIPILNADKPPLDYHELERRLGQFDSDQTVWLTRAATFLEKSRLFPGATFIVGADTLVRIADPRFYGDDPAARAAAFRELTQRGCRFLVFGRAGDAGFLNLSDLDLPEELTSLCRAVPAKQFRNDISSTKLRRGGEW